MTPAALNFIQSEVSIHRMVFWLILPRIWIASNATCVAFSAAYRITPAQSYQRKLDQNIGIWYEHGIALYAVKGCQKSLSFDRARDVTLENSTVSFTRQKWNLFGNITWSLMGKQPKQVKPGVQPGKLPQYLMYNFLWCRLKEKKVPEVPSAPFLQGIWMLFPLIITLTIKAN